MRHRTPCLALLLIMASGDACAQTVQATVNQVATAQQAPLVRGPVLLNPDDIAGLRAHPERFVTVLKGCSTRLNYQARPLVSLNPQNHYNSTGVAAKSPGSQHLSDDASMSYRFGLCYLLTGQAEYAASAQRILDAWAGTLKQATTPQGQDDVNFNLPYMILAASWVRGADGWNSSTFDTFLRQTVLPLSLAANPNNHGLWAMLMEASAGAYLGDARILTQARNRWQDIIMGAVNPDGQMPREITRSDTSDYHGGATMGIKGLAYTHYALLPASMAAKIFADAGQPVWNTPAGKRLGKAYAQAAAWTLHPETFPYYQRNNGKLVGVNNAAYFTLLQRYYPNADAQAFLQQQGVTQKDPGLIQRGVPISQGKTMGEKIGMNGFFLLQLFAQ